MKVALTLDKTGNTREFPLDEVRELIHGGFTSRVVTEEDGRIVVYVVRESVPDILREVAQTAVEEAHS